MVDEQRFSGGGGGLGKVFLPRQHIDEAGLADVAAPDEGVFRLFVLWALADDGTALDVCCTKDIHVCMGG